MTSGDLPLSASDLHAIAAALEPIELLPEIAQNPVIGRIEVIRPDGDDVVGYFVREVQDGTDLTDAWLGFTAGSQL